MPETQAPGFAIQDKFGSMSNLDLQSKIQVQSKKDAGSWEQSAKLGMSQEVVDGTTGWGRHRKTGTLNNGDARRGGHQTNFQNKGKECHRKMGDGAGREYERATTTKLGTL